MAKIIIGTALKVRIRECFHIIRNYQWEYAWTDNGDSSVIRSYQR